VKTLRQLIGEMMVSAHLISPKLAEYHVARMTNLEVEERFQMYARNGISISIDLSIADIAVTELSVAGPKTRAGHLSSTRFSGPATMTAGPRRSTLFPRRNRAQVIARFGSKEPGPKSGSGLSPSPRATFRTV